MGCTAAMKANRMHIVNGIAWVTHLGIELQDSII